MDERNSVLDSVKQKLGMIPEELTEFDSEVIDYINLALSTLTQLGIGPATGFEIHDRSTTWEDLLGSDPRLNMARTYVYAKVRLLFNPPQTSFVLTSLQEQVKEYEWRLNVYADSPESFPPI